MIPESFHQQQITPVKSDRRKSDDVINRQLEIIEQMNAESKAVNAEVRQIMADTETIIKMRFDQVDANIIMIHDDTRADMKIMREDNKAFHAELMARLEEKQATQDKRITAVEGCVDVATTGLSKRMDGIEDRVKNLETAPIKDSANKWNQTRDKVLFGFIGLLIAGCIAWASSLINNLTGGPK